MQRKITAYMMQVILKIVIWVEFKCLGIILANPECVQEEGSAD
jgi:hypothetical protein